MTSGEDMLELEAGLKSIAEAIRPIVHVAEGSGRLTPIGSAFAVRNRGIRYLITADHVLAGLEDKLMGVDAEFSTRWPRSFSRLVSDDSTLPDADIAWVAIRMFEETLEVGATIPLEQTIARVAGGDANGFMAVGHPVSKSRMVEAQSAVASKLMMAQVRIADEATCVAIGIDDRVQFALSYDSNNHTDLAGRPIVPAQPKGMSGGVVVATTRANDANGKSFMKPYVVGVLTRFYPEHRTYVATKIEHLWKAIGILPDNDRLYREMTGSYIRAADV